MVFEPFPRGGRDPYNSLTTFGKHVTEFLTARSARIFARIREARREIDRCKLALNAIYGRR